MQTFYRVRGLPPSPRNWLFRAVAGSGARQQHHITNWAARLGSAAHLLRAAALPAAGRGSLAAHMD